MRATGTTLLRRTVRLLNAEGAEAQVVRHAYFVPRVGKTGDSLPVYTDVRNGGTRTLTEIRKVQGNLEALREDLTLALFPHGTGTGTGAGAGAEAPTRPPKPGSKASRNPSASEPVQTSRVNEAGKVVVRGNKVRAVKAFLESKGF